MSSVDPALDVEARIAEALAQTALDRVRVAMPWLIFGVATALAISPIIGIPVTPSIVVVNGVVIVGAIAMWVALRSRTVPLRYAHALCAGAWMMPPVTTLSSQLANREPWLVIALTIALTAAALQVSFRFAVASTAAVATAYVPLALRDGGTHTVFLIAAVYGAAVAGCLINLVMRRWAIEAHRLHLQEQRTANELRDAAAELSHELDERRRAERERERLREQFVHAQRHEAVGTLAAGMAHDMNNILAGILGVTESMLEVTTEPASRDDCATIIREAQRGAELTRSLLAFSRRGQYQRQPTLAASLVAEIDPLLARTLPRTISLVRAGATSAVVDVDRGQLTQALVNLCLNAADAMQGSGTLTIETDEVTLPLVGAERLGLPADRRWVRISVTDTGCGMDEATRLRIFEPFFTTKPIGRGTGLGLAMVHGAVMGHDGAIEVASAPDEGSTFRIYLPIVEREPAISSAPLARGVTAAVRGMVLVVDDEPLVRTTVSRMLERCGFGVILAENGAEALEVFDRRGAEIQLVVLDMSMPVMGGNECFRKLRERSNVPVLLASGFTLDHEAQALLAADAAGFLDKPFSRFQLDEKITKILGPL